MIVLFLDVDGPIHNDGSYLKYGQMVNIGAVKLLDRLIQENNIKVVFSSTWCLGVDKVEIGSYLALMGFSSGILHEDYKTRDSVPEHRGELIAEWLDRHDYVENYIIVDDDDDMLPSQKNNFIHVDDTEGFSVRDYYRALAIIKGYRTSQCNIHENKGYV